MDVEIVTPAGRKRYLKILYKYLKNQKNSFSNWTIWLNTLNEEDIEYCQDLERENEWIKIINCDIVPSGSFSVHSFYKYACDPNKIYIKMDDDIVWMEHNFIEKLVQFRLLNKDYFLVCANTVNNAINDHIHQRNGALNIPEKISYSAFDQHGWSNPHVALQKHLNLISSILGNNLDKYKFDKIILNIFERYSINCISWFGSDFEKFAGMVGLDDEDWLTTFFPQSIKKFNIICGQALCAHFAFFPQREFLDHVNLIHMYENIEKFSNERILPEYPNDKTFQVMSSELRPQLIKEITDIGLYKSNDRHFYGMEYHKYTRYRAGLWQHPEEFAELCILLRTYKINTFLNIGTFNGFTFNYLSDFLNRYQKTKCITIDPINHNPVLDNRFTYINTTSKEFQGHNFDLVFIDGDHEYDSVKLDYENVGQYAKICVFHDIKDEFCRDFSKGGPMKFWNEIKNDSCFELFAEKKPLPQTMGIGIKFNI